MITFYLIGVIVNIVLISLAFYVERREYTLVLKYPLKTLRLLIPYIILFLLLKFLYDLWRSENE